MANLKIYFEDGSLCAPNFKYDCKIDAAEGCSANRRAFIACQKTNPDSIIYTNSTIVLEQSYYAWNDNCNEFDIFVREGADQEFMRINEAFGHRIFSGARIDVLLFSGIYRRVSEIPASQIFKTTNGIRHLVQIDHSNPEFDEIYECPYCDKRFGDEYLSEKYNRKYCPHCCAEVLMPK